MALSLSASERKLLDTLEMDINHRQGYTIDEIGRRLGTRQNDAELRKRIFNLKTAMAEHGVTIWERDEKYWVDYGEAKLDIIRKAPRTFLYLTPGKGGLGTYLFDPMIAEGLNRFLSLNSPDVKGIPPGKKYLDCIDAVIINGGFSSVPTQKSASSQESAFMASLLEQLPSSLTTPQRKAYEDNRTASLRAADVPPEIVSRYEAFLSGKIKSREDLGAYVQFLLTRMFGNKKTKIYYHPGEEDSDNKKFVKTELAEGIRVAWRDYTTLEGRLEHSKERHGTYQFQKAVMLHVMEELILAEKYILDDKERLVKAYNAFNETGKWDSVEDYDTVRALMTSLPRRARERKTFESLLGEYVDNNHARLAAGDFHRYDQYIGSEQISRRMKDSAIQIGMKILEDLQICRTYRGLGWRITMPKSAATKADADIIREVALQSELNPAVGSAQTRLHSLGWLENKPLSDADLSDTGVIGLFAEEKMQSLYRQIADGFDLRLLDKGDSDFVAAEVKFRVQHRPTNSNPGTEDLTDTVNRLYEQSMTAGFKPDVWLMGPSSGSMGVFFFRAGPENILQAPHLKYEDRPESTAVFQLGHAFTTAAISRYLTEHPKHKAGFPGDDSTHGEIVLDTIMPDSTHHFSVIDVEDLLRICAEQDAAKAAYKPSVSIIGLDDLHFGEASSYLNTTQHMHIDAICEYIRQELKAPNILKMSEVIDSAQKLGSTDLGHKYYGFSRQQVEAAIDNIRSSPAEPKMKLALLTELALMQLEARQEPNLDVQMQLALRSNLGGLIEDVAARDGYILYSGGDHAQRVTGVYGSEAIKLKNGFERDMVTLPSGERISVASRIYTSSNHESITGEIFFDGSSMGIQTIYATHKMERDIAGQARNAGLPEIVLSAHRHHPHFVKDGRRKLMVSPGLAFASPYVREAGMHANLKGIMRLELPAGAGPYENSVSVSFVPEQVLLNHSPETRQRIQLRELLVGSYIPAQN